MPCCGYYKFGQPLWSTFAAEPQNFIVFAEKTFAVGSF